MKKTKKIVCRTMLSRLSNGMYQVKAFDQGNNRLPEADFCDKDRQVARDKAREMVNKAKSPED